MWLATQLRHRSAVARVTRSLLSNPRCQEQNKNHLDENQDEWGRLSRKWWGGRSQSLLPSTYLPVSLSLWIYVGQAKQPSVQKLIAKPGRTILLIPVLSTTDAPCLPPLIQAHFLELKTSNPVKWKATLEKVLVFFFPLSFVLFKKQTLHHKPGQIPVLAKVLPRTAGRELWSPRH